MGMLANLISTFGNGPVVDKTSLQGFYDFKIRWAIGSDSDGRADGDLFAALRQQAGLMLQPEKVPVRILVIDHAERLTAN